MITLLVDPIEIDGQEVEIEGEKYKHLFRARRLPVGNRVRVVDGRGRARWGRVERVDARVAVIQLQEAAAPNELGVEIDLFVACPRSPRLKMLIEKTTEIGVTRIRLIESDRAARSVAADRIERLARVARAAVEQCQRARVPEISGPHSWAEMLALLTELDCVWYLNPESGGARRSPSGTRLGLVVGPEGGLTVGESTELERSGGVAVGLGPTILRTETAAIVGVALLAVTAVDR